MGPLARWLQRPSRVPRSLRALTALLMGTAALLMLAGGPNAAPGQSAAPTSAAGAGNVGSAAGTEASGTAIERSALQTATPIRTVP